LRGEIERSARNQGGGEPNSAKEFKSSSQERKGKDQSEGAASTIIGGKEGGGEDRRKTSRRGLHKGSIERGLPVRGGYNLGRSKKKVGTGEGNPSSRGVCLRKRTIRKGEGGKRTRGGKTERIEC